MESNDKYFTEGTSKPGKPVYIGAFLKKGKKPELHAKNAGRRLADDEYLDFYITSQNDMGKGYVFYPERDDSNDQKYHYSQKDNENFIRGVITVRRTVVLVTDIKAYGKHQMTGTIKEILWLKDNGYTFTVDPNDSKKTLAIPPKALAASVTITDYDDDQNQEDGFTKMEEIRNELRPSLNQAKLNQTITLEGSITEFQIAAIEEGKEKAELQQSPTALDQQEQGNPKLLAKVETTAPKKNIQGKNNNPTQMPSGIAKQNSENTKKEQLTQNQGEKQPTKPPVQQQQQVQQQNLQQPQKQKGSRLKNFFGKLERFLPQIRFKKLLVGLLLLSPIRVVNDRRTHIIPTLNAQEPEVLFKNPHSFSEEIVNLGDSFSKIQKTGSFATLSSPLSQPLIFTNKRELSAEQKERNDRVSPEQKEKLITLLMKDQKKLTPVEEETLKELLISKHIDEKSSLVDDKILIKLLMKDYKKGQLNELKEETLKILLISKQTREELSSQERTALEAMEKHRTREKPGY